MTDIRLDTEWHDGEGIRGAELSSTFASLKIEIQGELVTRVHDRRAKTVRDSVYLPLYPLAEWLVSNWWFLGHECENPVKSTNADFRRRHALNASTEGYVYPGLRIVSSGTRTQIVWGGDDSTWTGVSFLRSGQAAVDRDEFLSVGEDFVDKVVRRLLAFGIRDTFLQREWAAIQSTDDEESAFCETAAGLGWDPYELDEMRQKQVLMISEELGNLLEEAVPVLSPSKPVIEATAITAAIEAAQINGLQFESLKPLIANPSQHGGFPWDAGYALARDVRRGLDLDGQPMSDLEALAEALNEDVAAIGQAMQPLSNLTDLRLIDGVVTTDAQGIVSFGVRKAGEHGRRFHFCRALAEIISSHGQALITKGHTERQQRNRAFAAEFLAPSSSLRQRISHSVVDSDEVDELAEEFAVSPQVIVHQIKNHRIARVSEEAMAY